MKNYQHLIIVIVRSLVIGAALAYALFSLTSCTKTVERIAAAAQASDSTQETKTGTSANQFTVLNNDYAYASLDSFSINGVMYRTGYSTNYRITVDSIANATVRIYINDSTFTANPPSITFNSGANSTMQLFPAVFDAAPGYGVDSVTFTGVIIDNNAEISMNYFN